MPSYLRPIGNWPPSRLTKRQRSSAIFFYPYPNHAIVLLVRVDEEAARLARSISEEVS